MTSQNNEFEERVFPAELREVAKRRTRLGLKKKIEPTGKPSVKLGMIGLAHSGGGIRSATFGLGVIQALARHGLLKQIDYLSTVSGGGFIGSCLSSLLNSPDTGPAGERFPLLNVDSAVDPPAVSHLRNSGKYLASGGLLDKLRIPAIAVRGVLGNLFVFLIIILVTVLATKVVYSIVPATGTSFSTLVIFALLAFALLVLAFPFAARVYHRHSTWSVRNAGEALFTVALLAAIGTIFLVPLFLLVDQAVDHSWSDMREGLAGDLQRPFESDDYFGWLAAFTALILFMFVGRASARLHRWTNKLVIVAVGLIGPVVLLLLYLALVLIQVDSPYVSASRLFSLPPKHASELARETLSPELRRRFEEAHVYLPAESSVESLEPRRRWIVKAGDRRYSLVLENEWLGVYPDFVGMLAQRRVATEFKTALQRKGLLISKHPTVAPASAHGGPGSAYRISGIHRFRLLDQPPAWTLAQVSEPEVVAAAVDAAYSGVHLSSRPPHTLIHMDTVLSDADREAALRFVSIGMPQDVALVIDNALPKSMRSEAFARLVREELSRAFSRPIEAAQMAVILFDRDVRLASPLAAASEDDFFHLAQSPAGTLDRSVVERMAFAAADSNAPAALLRAARELIDHGRGGARKSIVFLGRGSPNPGDTNGSAAETREWLRTTYPAMLKEAGIRFLGVPLSEDAELQLMRDLAQSTRGSYQPVFGRDAETVRQGLRTALGKVLRLIEAESPATGPMRVSDRNRPVRYALSWVGPFVRVDADITAASLRHDDLPASKAESSVSSAVRAFFAEHGIELAAGAVVAKIDQCGASSTTRAPRACWEVRDPYAYLAGLNDGRLMVRRADEPPASPWRALLPTKEIDRVLLVVLALLVLYGLAVDVNATSAHRFYRDRLSKAYLIKLRRDRGIAHDDRQKLSELNGEGAAAPYHLVNVALNLQGSNDLSLRGRGSDFFVFSKCFVGSPRVGFAPTEMMEQFDPNLDLGTAMAISGAAAAPNMGTTTVRPLVFILTMLNVRLGYWIPNPGFVTRAGPLARLRARLGPGSTFLLKEALGRLDTRGAYLNVSDGGHIENLALYELLRRRCALIVAVDGEADPEMRFGGLVQLMLYARIDLGIEIDIDLEPIRKNAEGLSQAHWALGTIRYPNNEVGTLIYIKSSVSGDEHEYIREYRARHPTFPHESTSDQFFDERQFEAYRALGYHIGEQAFANAEVARAFRR